MTTPTVVIGVRLKECRRRCIVSAIKEKKDFSEWTTLAKDKTSKTELKFPGNYTNLEIDVIPLFLQKLLQNNDTIDVVEEEVSEEVDESRNSPHECRICSVGGNLKDLVCCWQQHKGPFHERLYSIVPCDFPVIEGRVQHLYYKRIRFSAYKLFAAEIGACDDNDGFPSENPPLPPCIELRLKYWLSGKKEIFRKY